jgi:hypothetical protein
MHDFHLRGQGYGNLFVLTSYYVLGADPYFSSRLPVVSLRLAQGGVRLAATLNRIFG